MEPIRQSKTCHDAWSLADSSYCVIELETMFLGSVLLDYAYAEHRANAFAIVNRLSGAPYSLVDCSRCLLGDNRRIPYRLIR